MKILKVKLRSIIYFNEYNQHLKPVMSKRFIKNGYTHIELSNRVFDASEKNGVVTLGEPISSGW